MPKKLYQVLGIDDETVDDARIRVAYRKLALKLHPDKNHDTDTTEQFKQVTAAYEILGNPTKRQQYNEGLINESGDPVQSGSPKQQHPPSQNERASTGRPHEPGFAAGRSHERGFFQSPPTGYYFFNSQQQAAQFGGGFAKGRPVFMYVTPSPLDELLRMIKAAFNQHVPTKTAPFDAKIHPAASGVGKGKNNPQPAHVSVKTNYPAQMEQIIDRLIAKLVLLEMVDKGQGHNNTYNGPSASKARF